MGLTRRITASAMFECTLDCIAVKIYIGVVNDFLKLISIEAGHIKFDINFNDINGSDTVSISIRIPLMGIIELENLERKIGDKVLDVVSNFLYWNKCEEVV